MKSIRFFGLVLAAVLGSDGLFAQTNAINALPTYLTRFAPEIIRADGKLDETAWATTPWSSEYVWIDAGDPAPLKARFKSVYNSTGLHFAFEFEAIREPGQPLDPDLPSSCGIFLDPEGDGRRYLEYAVSPEAVVHTVTWIGNPSMSQWRGEAGITSQVGVGRTTLDPKRERVVYEITFPWNGMKTLTGKHRFPPTRGEAWRVNFSRTETGGFRGDYAWAPTGGFYTLHHPGSFGWLVFAGETDPLTEVSAAALNPREDAALQIRGSRRFPLVSRALWARWLAQSKEDTGFFVASATYVARLDAKGQTEWRVTRAEGLPQFVQSAAVVGDNLYLAGIGRNAGLVTVDAGGRLNRNAKGEHYELDLSATLLPLNPQLALAVSGDRYQLIRPDGIVAPVKTQGKIQCAVALGDDRIVVGTPDGFEMFDGKGRPLQRVAIAGGIVHAAAVDNAVVGASGKDGLFRITAEGACAHYPRPLRTKFERVYADSLGRCWATYTGGVALITGDRVDSFSEPIGLAGFEVFDAAAAGDGRMVFAARHPNGDGYGSLPGSPFLLVTDGRRFWRYSFRDGLPAQFESVEALAGKIFLCTSAGVFQFRP